VVVVFFNIRSGAFSFDANAINFFELSPVFRISIFFVSPETHPSAVPFMMLLPLLSLESDESFYVSPFFLASLILAGSARVPPCSGCAEIFLVYRQFRVFFPFIYIAAGVLGPWAIPAPPSLVIVSRTPRLTFEGRFLWRFFCCGSCTGSSVGRRRRPSFVLDFSSSRCAAMSRVERFQCLVFRLATARSDPGHFSLIRTEPATFALSTVSFFSFSFCFES